MGWDYGHHIFGTVQEFYMSLWFITNILWTIYNVMILMGIYQFHYIVE